MKGRDFVNRKIMIVGRSGCGKDTVAACLTKNFGLKQLISTTTRPPRYTGEATHVFVSEKEANEMTDRVAETVINGYQYFATKQQFAECDVYTIDPKGLSDVCVRASEEELCVVYVSASKSVRQKRAIDRAEDKEEAKRVFDARHNDENRMFSEFERLIEGNDLSEFHKTYPTVGCIIIVNNDKGTLSAVNKKSELVMMYANQIDMGEMFGPYKHSI